jgi:HEAT repeats
MLKTVLLAPGFFGVSMGILLLPAWQGAAAAERSSSIASFGVGPHGAALRSGPGTLVATPVWVDTVAKTLIEGWTEYNPSTCTSISAGSFTTLLKPTHGKLFFSVENFTLANGDCPGILFPFAIARYTWTDAKQKVLQDPFTLQWTTPDGMFTETDEWSGQLAKIELGQAVWWVCSASNTLLPTTGNLTLTNPPSTATSFAWTISAGDTRMVFSNGTSAVTTTANKAKVKSLAASTAMNDVSMSVVVQNLSYLFDTSVRTPKQLKRRTDLDSDGGRGANCAVSGNKGWQSLIGYEVDDQFGVNTSEPDNADAGISEKFGAKTDKQVNDWPIPTEGGSSTANGLFNDNMCITTTAFNPAPLPPQAPLTNNLVDQIKQTWFAGSPAVAPNQGCKVQTDTFTRYIDHGRHKNITSPAVLEASSAAGFSLSTADATGYPVPVLNVRRLMDQASLVVKGRVLAVTPAAGAGEEGGSQRRMSASVQVDNVVKGALRAGAIAIDYVENEQRAGTMLAAGEVALLFLVDAPRGRYLFADADLPKMAITSASVPAAKTAATAADKLEAELMASLTDADAEVARTALVQLGHLESVHSTQALRDLATGGDAESRGLAHASLLRLKDYALFDQAIDWATQPARDQRTQRLQAGIKEAVGDISDASMVAALTPLLGSADAGMRRAAASALRSTGDPSTLGVLVAALRDKDRAVQYDALMALAEITHASAAHAPARDVFDRAPQKYVSEWEAWWKASGKSRYGSPR